MPPLTPVVRSLVILNVVVFLVDQTIGLPALAMYVPNTPNFYPFQVVTHMFMHANIVHIAMNMLWLAMIGSLVEMVWGSKRLLFFYLACGLGAVALHMAVTMWQLHGLEQAAAAFELAPTHGHFVDFFINHANKMGVGLNEEVMAQVEAQLMNGDKSIAPELTKNMQDAVVMIRDSHRVVGASGCVFGVMVAFAFLFPNQEMGFFMLPFRMSSRTFVGLMLLTEVIRGISDVPGDNVAHFAHLGGALLGTLVILGWYGELRWPK